MELNASSELAERTAQAGHNTALQIKNYAERNYGSKSEDIIKKIFSQKVFDFIYTEDDEEKRDRKEHFDELSNEDLSAIFFDTYYRDDYDYTRPGEKGKASKEEVLDNLFNESPYDIKTHTTWLTGPVGSGKSSALSCMIYKNRDRFIENNRIVFRIDIDRYISKDTEPSNPTPLPSQRQFARLVLQKLEEALAIQYPNLDWNDISEVVIRKKPRKVLNVIQVLYGVIRHLSKHHKIYTTIILDNMDFLLYQFDRYLFTKRLVETRKKAIEQITEFIRIFRATELDGCIGLTVLFATRHNSVHWIRHADRDRFLHPEDTYSIAPKPPDEVMIAHLEFLGQIVADFSPESESKFEKIITGAITAIEDKDSKRYRAISRCRDLCNDGLRGIVASGGFCLIPSISIDEPDGGDAIIRERLQEHAHPLPLITMLRHLSLYSQDATEFPNIFLVRADNQTIDEEYVGTHRITYLLKLFILKYVARQTTLKRRCTPRTVIQVFSPKGAPPESKYPRELVELAIGSLFSSAGSGLLEVGENDFVAPPQSDLQNHSLQLTNRGKKLIEDRRYFEFLYLQLVVDDWLLPLPWILGAHFDYKEIENQNLDYRYLLFPDSAEHERFRIAMILEKFKNCLIFFDILRTAFDEEIIHYSAPYKTLVDLGALEGNRDCIDEAEERLKKEALGLLKRSRMESKYSDIVDTISAYTPTIAKSITKLYRYQDDR